MADNSTGLNAQYSGEFFPGLSAGTGSSAPGSQGDTASETGGTEVGSPVVSVPGASSQVPASMPRVSVTSGDTSGMSSDQAVQASPITPGPVDAYLTTGAGKGSGSHYPRRPGQQAAQ